MRIFSLILVFLAAVGCRTGATLDEDGQRSDAIVADMEDLAIELVHVMSNSWCEAGNPRDRCYLDADGDHDITHVSLGHHYRGEYDVEVDGVLFGESELDGHGTVAYDWETDEVNFSGLMSVNDSTMYSVKIHVIVIGLHQFEVYGSADGVGFAFDLRRRPVQRDNDDDDDDACRTTEIGIACE